MRFDSNSAWREATQSVSANREVLAAVGGVFFLLPGLAGLIFLGDYQADLMANLGNQAALRRAMENVPASAMFINLIALALQLAGYLALLALLTDRTRPTVGEALTQALRALPTAVGVTLLFFFGFGLVAMLAVMLSVGLAAISGALMALVPIALFVGMIYCMVKFSLVLPVVVIEQQLNPVTALARSWRLTKGNSFRMFGFYVLLAIIYFVIIMVVTMVIMALAVAIAGQGKVALLIGGLVSGVVGAAASVLLIAILAAIHRQLAGPSSDALGATFD